MTKLRLYFIAFLTVTILEVGLGGSLFAANSVKRHEITWTFDDDYKVGTFANGDPWVQEKTLGGGVKIINIDPKPSTGPGGAINGSMVNPDGNPWAKQGYDERRLSYDASRNLAAGGLPFTVNAGDSLVTAISYNISNLNQQRPVISDASVLTIVAANDTPATGDFRPPYVGTYKPRWNIADIRWDRLPSLSAPVGTGSIASSLESVDRLWLLNALDATGREIHPRNHMPEYGRDFSILLSNAMLRTLLSDSNSVKQPLVVEMIQKGIDIYGCTNMGMTYYANGGLNCGMKMPLVYAGYLLNSPEILDYADKEKHFIFQEDQQTFYVSQADVNDCPKKSHTSGATRDCYTSSMIGLAEWGFNHKGASNQDGSNWGAIYRDVAGPGMVGHFVVASLMGVQDIWNWPAFFDYFDRYIGIEGDSVASFPLAMWLEYGDSGPGGYVETQARSPAISPQGGSYSITEPVSVSLSSDTSGASIYYTTDGSTPTQSSTLYTGAFTVAETSTIKAIATADGLDDSQVGQASFIFSDPDNPVYSSTTSWQNESIDQQTDSFVATLSITPTNNAIDTVIGFSPSAASSWNDMAVILRFNSSSTIDVRNGGSYTADTAVAYSSGVTYDFTVQVNMAQKTYSVWVSANGLPQTQIANGFAFRTSQAGATQMDYLSFQSAITGVTISDFAIETNNNNNDGPPIGPSALEVSPT